MTIKYETDEKPEIITPSMAEEMVKKGKRGKGYGDTK
jgi:hypothetical protein